LSLATTPPFPTLSYNIYSLLVLQLVELKEAEQQSLKESERLEKEIAEVQELKVNGNGYFIF
jgi:hypothetical protein